jgi:hypothetical protein
MSLPAPLLFLRQAIGSQPVCRGTLVCRELLPSAPRGFELKNDYKKLNMQIKKSNNR